MTTVNIKFDVDAEWIELLISLRCREGVTDYETWTDEMIPKYVQEELKESKEAVQPNSLEDTIPQKTSYNYVGFEWEIRNVQLFVLYHIILKRDGFKWLLQENQNVVVYNDLSAVQPALFNMLLKSDIDFDQNSLR